MHVQTKADAQRQQRCSKASWPPPTGRQTDRQTANAVRRQYLLQLPRAGLSVSHSLFAPYPFLTEQTLENKIK